MPQIVDAAARLDAADVKAAGFDGAVRYIAPWINGAPNPKCITRDEFDADVAAGLPVALVFEQGIHNAEGGAAQGTHDGQVALAAVRGLGIPDGSGCHVYVAVDEDVPTELWATVAAYLDAFQAELAAAGHLRDGYGKYALGRQMLADHHAVLWWESGAWSGSNRLQGTPGASLFQRIATVNVGGVQCDVNDVWADDWGQWPRPSTPVATSSASSTPGTTPPTEENLIMAVAQSDDDGRRTNIRDWCTRYWGYGAMTGDDQNILAYWGGSNPLDLVLAHIIDHPKAAAYRSAHGE